MKAGKKVRVVLDVAMTIMLVLEMFIQFTGVFLHEIIGFAFFATIIAHMLLSVSWVKSTARVAKKGKMSGRRLALAVVGSLLALAVLLLAVSSIAISNLVASTGFVWPIGSYALWATVHSASAYALCALVVVHLAMHWAFLASAFRVPYNPSRRRAIGAGVHAAAALGAIALGVTAVSQANPSLASALSGAAASTDGQQEPARTSDRDFSSVSDKAPAADASASGESQLSKPSKSDRSGKSAEAEAVEPTATVESDEPTTVVEPDEPVEPTTAVEPIETVEAVEPFDTVETSDAVEVTGICTLCRKQCPLSAPRCNKPYDAGLI